MDNTQAIELLTSLTEKIGDDTEIEALTAGLSSIADYLGTIQATLDQLETDLEKANTKAMELRKANNELFRQISFKDESAQKAKTALDEAAELAAYF